MLYYPSRRAEYLHKLFAILHGSFDSSPPFIIQSFIYISLDSWIFIGYFEFYSDGFVVQIVLTLVIRSFFSGSFVSLSYFQQCVKCSNWFWLKLLWGEFNKWILYKGEIRAAAGGTKVGWWTGCTHLEQGVSSIYSLSWDKLLLWLDHSGILSPHELMSIQIQCLVLQMNSFPSAHSLL